MLSQELGRQLISSLSTQHEEIYNAAVIIIRLCKYLIKFYILKFSS